MRRAGRSSVLCIGVLAVGALTTTINFLYLGPLLGSIAAEFGVSTAAAGQAVTLHAAVAALAALVVAPWLYRFPRRTMLRFEAVLLAVGTLLTATAPSLGWFFAGRAVAGLGGGFVFATCLAAAGDLFPAPAARNRAVGAVWAASTVAGVAGLPLVTQVDELAGWRAATAVVLAPIALALAGTWCLPAGGVARRGGLWRDWLAGYGGVLAHGQTLWLLGIVVVLNMVWGGWLVYFAADANARFGVGANTLSALFLVSGVSEFAGSSLAPSLLRRRPARELFAVGSVALAVNLVGAGLVYARSWMLFPFIGVASLALAALGVTVNVLLMDGLPAAQGTVMSLQSAGMEVGWGLGAAISGLALTLGGFEAVYPVLAAALPLGILFLVMSARSARNGRSTGVIAHATP